METRDSISEIWGARSPHYSEWPVRVDSRFDKTPTSWIQSTCLLCSTGCAVDIGVAEGGIVGVRGREVDRVNKGRLGPKGLHGWVANNSPERLTAPLIRDGDSFRRASWDEAMSLIVRQTRKLRQKYTSGALG